MSLGERAPKTRKMMGKMTGKVLELLATDPHLTIPELATILGKSESTIERAIRELRKLGRLKRVGSRKGGHWEVGE
ncbi:MAG: winged helix-turn-helix transcriptional regulator [Desulforhopalus sp.]|nr:winged helix-turn-helix transcriptional regulator [Desulforhopalus sp.]